MVATSYTRQMLGSTAHEMCVGKASYMIPRLQGLSMVILQILASS